MSKYSPYMFFSNEISIIKDHSLLGYQQISENQVFTKELFSINLLLILYLYSMCSLLIWLCQTSRFI
jgi:hypothetical protein